MKSPNHIAIIMDGNGRWGIKNYKSRLIGHKFGVKNIKPIVQYCLKNKINYLTLFALSMDNLKKRNKKEIKNLLGILEQYLKENIKYFIDNKIKLNFIGEKYNLSKNTIGILYKYSKDTDSKKQKLQINVAFNYSSKFEIVNSFKKIIKNRKNINKKNICKYLYTSPAKEPEIIIRTGGFSRLSDFLLWQCAYSEFFFIKKMWPDFKPYDLQLIIKKFNKLKRNFGS